jgi:hypothetical protein
VTGVGVASELASWPEQGAEMPASKACFGAERALVRDFGYLASTILDLLQRIVTFQILGHMQHFRNGSFKIETLQLSHSFLKCLDIPNL